jgi:uncharacterized protein YndB with AHSA1/START domain
MSETFVYVTYIRTTQDKLWAALMQPQFTRQYWMGHWQDCAWTPGASWKLTGPDGVVKDAGEVLEFTPQSRIVLRWRNQFRPDLHAEGDSQASFELEPDGDQMKLTVTHTHPTTGSALIKAVSNGWPKILSNLKSLLEGHMAAAA